MIFLQKKSVKMRPKKEFTSKKHMFGSTNLCSPENFTQPLVVMVEIFRRSELANILFLGDMALTSCYADVYCTWIPVLRKSDSFPCENVNCTHHKERSSRMLLLIVWRGEGLETIWPVGVITMGNETLYFGIKLWILTKTRWYGPLLYYLSLWKLWWDLSFN